MRLLADLTIRSSVILAIGLTATALLRRRSAALRHFVLAAAVFAAGAAVPLTLLLPAWELPWPRLAAAASSTFHVSASREAGPATVQGAVPARRAPADAGHADSARERESGPSQTYWGSGGGTISALIPIVWAGGVLVGAAVLLSGFGRLARIASRADRLQHGPWVRCAAAVAAAYGLRRQVVVLQTDASGLLATWGLFRPRVLLPSGANAWSDDRVHVVLCHELAHIRRHDWAVQIAAEALRTIYWFHPLVWIACARLRRDSEQACDDVVLQAGVPSREYAAQLLDLARLCRRPGPSWAAATPMARPSTLERRIAAMLNRRLDHQGLSRRAAVATGALLLAVTLPIAAVRAGQNALRPLEGAVYDPSGAVMPGVELKLEDAGQIKWQATSDASGHFEFPPVQSGKYVLEAAIPGFRPLHHEFELRSAKDWDRAITLQVGNLRETISVKASRVAGPAPAAAPAPRPVRVGGNIRVPHKIQHVAPVYPKSMRDAGREGEVPLEAVIGRDGTVQTVRVLSANVHPDFAIAAVDAVRQWRFDPTLLNGVPVDVVMTVTVSFSLSE
jgi:TonB family protein